LSLFVGSGIAQSIQKLGCGLDVLGIGVQFTAGATNCLFSTSSRLSPGPNPSAIQLVSEALSLGVKRQGVKLSTLLHLVPRLRMVELYFHSPTHLHSVVLN
jgi:hypothetical protein